MGERLAGHLKGKDVHGHVMETYKFDGKYTMHMLISEITE